MMAPQETNRNLYLGDNNLEAEPRYTLSEFRAKESERAIKKLSPLEALDLITEGEITKFTVYSKTNPELSLITIELDPNNKDDLKKVIATPTHLGTPCTYSVRLIKACFKGQNTANRFPDFNDLGFTNLDHPNQ